MNQYDMCFPVGISQTPKIAIRLLNFYLTLLNNINLDHRLSCGYFYNRSDCCILEGSTTDSNIFTSVLLFFSRQRTGPNNILVNSSYEVQKQRVMMLPCLPYKVLSVYWQMFLFEKARGSVYPLPVFRCTLSIP